MKAEEAQDAKVILLDALGRIADESDAARLQVLATARIVMQHAVGRERQGVDREVAAQRVPLEIGAETHLGGASIGFDVFA